MEDMRVRVEGDRVLAVSKQLNIRNSHGEYAGVSLLRGEAPRVYGDIGNGLEWSARTHIYYEDVYDMMFGRLDSRSAEVKDGEYAEVDTPDDIPAAVEVIDRFYA
jgi:choline kinase